MNTVEFAWLFRQRSLALTPIHTAQRKFALLQATELPDPTEFTTPGAVILTLGLAFEKDPEQLTTYIARLAAAGVVGIGFGTGLTFAEVPAPLITACRSHGLTLFEVPRPTKFATIFSTVNSELLRQAQNEQFTLNQKQDRLNQAAFRGLEQLVTQAARELSADIAVADSSRHLAAATPNTAHSPAFRLSRAAARGSQHGAARASRTTAEDGTVQYAISHTLRVHGRTQFGLAITATAPFDSSARSLIKHLSGLTTLLLHKDIQDRAATYRLNSLALAVLLDDQALPETVAQTADILAPVADTHALVQVLGLASDSPDQLSRALHAAEVHSAATNTPIMTLRRSPTTALILLPTDLSDLQPFFGPQPPRVSVIPATPWAQLTNAQVDQLLTHARSLPAGTRRRFDNAVPAWLATDTVQSALTRRRQATLDPLLTHDAAHGTDLARTLATYLSTGASLGTAADLLNIHRHTLRTRLDRIEDLIDIDLTNPVTRAELLLLSISAH